MNLDDLTIGEARELSKMFGTAKTKEKCDGTFVLVRTYSAGVHCGNLIERNGMIVKLQNARRIWRWRGANTLNELSQKGADSDYTRISEPVPFIELDAIEIIPCSEVAIKNLEHSRWPA